MFYLHNMFWSRWVNGSFDKPPAENEKQRLNLLVQRVCCLFAAWVARNVIRYFNTVLCARPRGSWNWADKQSLTSSSLLLLSLKPFRCRLKIELMQILTQTTRSSRVFAVNFWWNQSSEKLAFSNNFSFKRRRDGYLARHGWFSRSII